MPQMMINGCKLAYEEHGTGTNTVLFLHDLFFNGRSFHHQMVALRDRFRCVTLDLRGHGNSEGSSTGCSIDTLAEDVSQLINVQQYGACHLVAVGFGGVVAAMTALNRSDQVASLTLIGTSLDEASPRDARTLRQRRLHIKLFGPRFVTNALMRRAFSPGFIADPANAVQVEHFRKEFGALDRRALPGSISTYLTRPSLLNDLYRVRQPALIVGGALDAALTADDFTQLHNRLDPSRLVRIEDAGHAVHIERPNSLNQELLSFLQSVKPRSR